MKRILLLVLALTFAVDGYAAKKDFKGLFGSYRRERFTENEANPSDFGIDLMLSTLIPLSPIVKSQESVGGAPAALNYATFFNIEGGIHFSLSYNWLLFASIGYYNYDTRKENSATGLQNPALPLFHQFEMRAVPVVGGVKYRFSTEDIVPYVGIGVGTSFVTRHGFYDYSPQVSDEEHLTALTVEATLGVEFYFSARAGIRMEASAFYMKLPEKTFNSGAAPGDLPILIYQGNPTSIRYASGLFFLF